jgi:lipopolysaccharide export system protein LptC
VRWLRVIVLAGIAAVLIGVVAENYLPSVGEIRLPGELGKLVIKGTKITMQQPKLTGYTADSRPYEFTAITAAQDITKPDMVELQQLHARLQMEDKSTVEMTAPAGTYDMKAEKLVLDDDIALASSTGYAARLTEAVVDMHSGNVVSNKPVWVKLLNGFLNAKRMEITENGNVIHFDGGVSMTLHPDQDSDKAKAQ